MGIETSYKQGASTTAHVAALNRVHVGTGDLPPGALSPEMLLAYCASKMRGLDHQIQECFAKQQARNTKAAVLSDVQRTLSNYKVGFEKNPSAEKEISEAFAKAQTALAGDPALSAELQKTKAAYDASVTNHDHWASSDDMAGWMNSVQQLQQSLNQEGELEMLQMQSTMSQRQQAIQLCTNMLQSLGQSAQAICSNVGK
jgi:hypothetical protein